jgi:SpoVK/Ycf46/Vps4 family AAA+-type ATPase
MFRRWIRDIFELKNNKYAPFIFISSEPTIPNDLNHLFGVLYYDNPTQEEITDLLVDYQEVKDITINNINELAYKFIGFNRTEILECLDYSFYKYDKIDDSYIREKRIEVIKKSNVLRYKEPRMTMNDMAGNQFFKEWYQETKFAFEPDARKYGVPMPKGFMATGPAGTSKSLSAEMIAADLNIPLILLDLSAIMSKYVGNSEQNIDQAITTIKQIAPCVLLIDEVEKNLAGVESSHGSDSGTLARVFGKILNLLADNDNGIYTVMTSNNAKILPPELTRAGRLDAIFFFSFPTEEERVAIFDLHFKKRGHTISKQILKKVAKETKNYTGAEIEQIVVSAIKKAFVKMKKTNTEFKITSEIIIDAKNNVIPVSVSSKEQINALEDWAKGRALYTNKTPNEISKKKTALEKLEDINIDDII